MSDEEPVRCPWCGTDPLYVAYHDTEWGVPERDPRALFAEERSAVQFYNHPYGRPVIGWRGEMEALTREDALKWYEDHYAPNVAVLVVAVVGAPVLIFSPQGLPRLRGLEKELTDVNEENAELRRDIEALRGRVARQKDDPAAVERMARDNLGLVRQTEVVFQFQTRR